MTEDELIELGKDLRTRWDGGWRIDGRPIGNVEMDILIRARDIERRRRYERDGVCCDAGPWADGHCSQGGGMCPLYLEAEKLDYQMFRKGAT